MNSQVSVIIPAYNQARFLESAIRSVLAQTYKNYEIVLVDDGSTDETPIIVQQFVNAVHYIHQENRGLAAARNTAIRNAKAEIIALLDSDDLWDPEYLEKMIEQLDHNPQAAAVYCGFRYIDTFGQPIGSPNCRVVHSKFFNTKLISSGNWLVPSGVIFRKQLALDVGLFDEALRASEDADLWARLSAGHSFVGLEEVLISYRRHNNNMTKDPGHMIQARLKLIEKKYGPLDENVENDLRKKLSYSRLFIYGTESYLAYENYGESVNYFTRLLRLNPVNALSMPVWRLFCRAHIPLEYKNDPNYEVNLFEMESIILKLINEIEAQYEHTGSMDFMDRRIRICAYLALAEEGRIAGNSNFFYKYLRIVLSLDPTAIFLKPFWGRILRYVF